MQRQNKLEVPLKVLEQIPLTLDNLVVVGDETWVLLAKLMKLALDILAQVSNRCDVVVHLVVLAG